MTLSVQPQSGLVVENLYMTRTMTVYGMHEGEVEMMTHLNTQATVFFSVASGCVSIGAGIWVSAAFSSELSPEGKVLLWGGGPALIVLSAVFVALGIWSMRSRGSMLEKIRRQSRVSAPQA
ncbi:hypothetical protein OSH10_08350 [Kaistia defluvii]|uniref:hypothetical protein n=1 Tax=Kaistia defluvii TaxID=410841 RepID=UPI0022515E28|nr:hypothetical protein [Kaistia defluvii]MCX5518444.1 hypothetical protein [Kaistia defluvii]